MESQTHMVQKLNLLVKLHNRENAIDKLQQMAVFLKDQLIPSISSIFDSVCTLNQTIYLDLVEIDLGCIDLNNQNAVLEKFQAVFSVELAKYMQEKNPYVSSTDDHVFTQFIKVLETGYFSWNMNYKDFRELTEKVLALNWNSQWLERLINHLHVHEKSFKRLIFQAPTAFLERIQSEMIIHNKLSKIKVKQIEQNFLHQSKREQIEYLIAEIIFEESSVTSSKYKEDTFDSKMIKNKEQDIDPELLIPVSNAGMVLLNPVFFALFEGAELLTSNEFIDIQSREKAVFILHYLATGSLELDEFNSVLYKILCGMNLDHPLPNTIKLSKKILSLCNEAILSVLGQWKTLKNTGIEGLRENFICREGNLKNNDISFVLDVNKEAVDVILNYSPPPWTVGMIRLPWMKKVLKVNWY